MSIDINRFKKIFFEESLEGLDAMEAGLLALESEAEQDPETIHTIFRAAHSIKGGSGSFGFQDVMGFTHLLETLLDQMREGKRATTAETTASLLEAVDVLRVMLEAKQGLQDVDPARVASASARLEAILAQPLGVEQALSNAKVVASVAVQTTAGSKHWKIRFHPQKHLLRTGNEPLRLFRELSGLGELTVEPDASAVVKLSELNPEECLIGWRLELKGEVNEAQVREVFDWVEGDCDLEIAAAKAEAKVAIIAPIVGRQPAAVEGSSLRVSTEKVDAIINLVGELVITQSMLSQFGDQFDMSMLEKLRDGLGQLARNTRELQETVLKIRMLPISFCFNRFPRLVHDLSVQLGKKINLRVSGEGTEVDKTVLEKINEPLLHLIRNSLDHGVETPEARRKAGKPETGTIHMQASHRGGSIVIEIGDDGAGLNTDRILAKAREKGLVGASEALTKEKIEELIFAPGFSTAAELTDISGRGVGMDVVRRNIKELGGSIEIDNRPGQGANFMIRLPLTLAILDGQIVKVGDQTFVVPLVSIVESVQVRREQVSSISGQSELYRLRDAYLPIVRLYDVFQIPPAITRLEEGLLMVIEDNGVQAGIFVDDLLAQQQVVIKSMESNFRRVEGISGATILGDGTVSMILDIPGILNLSRRKSIAA
jgi:two-component system chemotaxis sensor kinase CheA